MSTKTRINKTYHRITAASLALMLFLSVFLTSFSKTVQADPVEGHRVGALWDCGKTSVGNGIQVEVFKAIDNNGEYVYCTKQGTLLPTQDRGGADLNDVTKNYASAKKIMGKIKTIIELPDSVFSSRLPYDFTATNVYVVKQLLIWNEIYKMESELSADGLYGADKYFRGYDLSSLPSSGLLAGVAQDIASSYANTFSGASSYSPSRPTYTALVQNKSSITFDTSANKYYATFEVTVEEVNSGTTGGTFSFSSINGGSVYAYSSSTGKYDTAVSSSRTFTVSSSALKFRIEGPYSGMTTQNNGKKGFNVEVTAKSGTGNTTQSIVNYGFFRNTDNDNLQTFVTLQRESSPTFEPDEAAWDATTGSYELTKYIRRADNSTEAEPNIRFRLYSTSYSDFYAAQSAGLGWEKTTNSSGKASWSNIPLGNYYLVQVDVPSNTYAMSPNPATVSLTGGTQYGTYYNDEKAGYVQVYKKVQTTEAKNAGTAFDNLPNESGATFQIYPKGSSYSAAPAYKKDTLTTGSNGKSNVSKALPVGTYVIHQTGTSDIANSGSDIEVTITEANTASAPYIARITNSAYELNIQIRKTDASTGAVIPAANVEFQVLSSDKTTVRKALDGTTNFKTDANGICNITNLNLPVGTYYLKEVDGTPDGYVKSSDLVEFTAKKGDSLITVDGYQLKRVDFPNAPVSLTLNLSKEGELLTGVTDTDTGYNGLTGKDFTYSTLALSGATFDLYCDTNVYDATGTTFRKANGVELKKGAKVGTYTTDSKGQIKVTGLYLDAKTGAASYYFVETSVPAGFILDNTPIRYDLTDTRTDMTKSVITADGDMTNARQKAELELQKVSREARFNDAGTTTTVDIPLKDAIFGVYAGEDIYGIDTTGSKVKLVDKDTLIEVLTSDANGSATTTVDLPLGYTYYMLELEAPQGFTKSDDQFDIVAKSTDDTTAKFTFVSDPVPNKPYGVDITLNLTKEGEMLTGTTTEDSEYGKVTTFTFSELPLAGAEFDLYCGSEVLDAEVGGTRYYKVYNGVELKTDALIGTYTTDAEGKITVSGLAVDSETHSATYYMVEKSAPEGFIIDKTPVVFEVSNAIPTKDMEVIAKNNIVSNKRQNAVLQFSKVGVSYKYDTATKSYVPVEAPLSDAVFGVYTREEIYGYALEGGVLTTVKLADADTLVELVKTGDDGKGITKSVLPLNGKFYIKELEAPEGYMKVDTEYDIETPSDPADNTSAVLTFEITEPIVNELGRTCLSITKIADDTKLPMANVEFEVIDPKTGDVIEKIVTDKEGKATTKTAIPYDATVILRETKTDEKYELMADEEIRIVVPQNDLTKYGVQDVTVYNFLKAEIAIVKVTGDGKETVMDGVTFELWKKGENGKADELVFTDTTDDKGELHFYVPVGEYYLKETSVGKWVNFTTLSEEIEVSASEHGKVYNFKLSDDYTTILVEKNDSKDGKPLGHCGISVKNAAGIVLTFVWNVDLNGYVYCDPTTEGATQVLYTNDNKDSEDYGKVRILGLETGKYEIYEVEAPEGYRNDSEVLGVSIDNSGKPVEVLHLYDTLKTAERDTVIGLCLCGFFGVTALTCLALAAVMFINRRKSRQN